MEELANFGMEKCLTLPSLANKYFNSLGDENDEPYRYTVPLMRNFVRQSIKCGRCNAFNQHYKTEISDDLFNIISKELNINSIVCDLLEKYIKYLNENEKQHAK